MKFKQLPLKKLNAVGATHLVALMLVIVGAGIIGTYELMASHAATVQAIAYCTNSGKVYSVLPGVKPKLLTTAPYNNCPSGEAVTFGQNGASIFYAGLYNIGSVSSTGQNVKQIHTTPANNFDEEVAFNEATHRIAFNEYSVINGASVSSKILIANPDGTSVKTVVNYTAPSGRSIGINNLQWSPNGQYMVYTFNSNTTSAPYTGTSQIVVVNVASGVKTIIYSGTSGGAAGFAIWNHGTWSNDSSYIIGIGTTVTSNVQTQTVQKWTISTKSFSAIVTAKSMAMSSIWDPSLSPSGGKLALFGWNGSKTSYQVVVMNSNGTGAKTISNLTSSVSYGSQEIDWSPDSTHLAVLWDGTLKTMSSDGTGLLQVAGSTSSTSTDRVNSFDWSIQ